MENVKSNLIDLSEILSDFNTADINALDVLPISTPNIFTDNSRKAWDNTDEARCNFKQIIRLTRRSNVFFISQWQKSIMGRTLTDIKSDSSMIPFFATSIAALIKSILGDNLKQGNYCICTTPKRRHKVNNFASLISEQIALIIDIPFYEDVALSHSRQRVNAVFTLNSLPKEQNIIIFDDFVTTGQTLSAMANLISPLGKNIIFFAGINNIL